MIKHIKRTFCVLMAVVLAFSTFGIAGALFVPSEEKETIIDVGSSFTAQADTDYNKAYKFTAAADGLHRLTVSFENDAPIENTVLGFDVRKVGGHKISEAEIVASLEIELDNEESDISVNLVFNAESGESYYFTAFTFFPASQTGRTYTVNCSFENLGTVIGASLKKAPDKLAYFDVNACESYGEQSLVRADFTGIEIELALENGGTYILTQRDRFHFKLLDGDYLSISLKYGKNNLTLSVFDCEPITYEVELIPYFTAISMTKNPDKLEYLYGLEGDWAYAVFVPAYDLTGAVIEATLHDGTSKTYALNDSIKRSNGAYEIEPGLYLTIFVDNGYLQPERINKIFVTTEENLYPCGLITDIVVPFECVKPTTQQIFMNLPAYIVSFFKYLTQKLFSYVA